MTPQQFSLYHHALHLEDHHLGFILGLSIEDAKTAIPAMKNGDRAIEEWVQPELMQWLTLYQQELQRLLALDEQGEAYVPLPDNAIKDRGFYERLNFYRPDIDSAAELPSWPAPEIEAIKDHLLAVRGEILLITFDTPEDAQASLGAEQYALFDNWLGGYNNFVRYAAGELRTLHKAYCRIDYSSTEHTVATLKELRRNLIDHMANNDGAVLPLRPTIDTTAYNNHALQEDLNNDDEEAAWGEFMTQRKAEAAKLAPAFDDLL